MSNLLTSLISSGSALRVFEQALMVSQNNVANASTPGYATQRLVIGAAEFEPGLGMIGGVRAGEVESARNLYAEQAVRRQVESLGYSAQIAESMTFVESAFDVTGTSGIPGALNGLFESFSAWSLDPNSSTARQQVLDAARQLVQSFQQIGASLEKASSDTDQQLRYTVSRINEIGAELRDYNTGRRSGGQRDLGLDTRIQTALEELSELVDFTSLHQADGTVTVLIGGQEPLVVGANLYNLRLDFGMPADPPPLYAGAPAPVRLEGADGSDITGLVSQGRLGGLLELRNNTLPSLGGDAYHVGELNVLAKSIADRVNQILTSAQVSDGPPPEPGVALFAYDATNEATVARTLTLASGITAAKLAAIRPGPPYVSNGAALDLAGLASPQSDADKIAGFSFVEYYGRVAGQVGRTLADAKEARDFRTETASQAKTLREQLSGVSLDEEAITILQFQRAYEANAKMVSVLSELTEAVINLMR